MITDDLMAMAEADTNWSSQHLGHAQQFNVGENLSWGYKDPFDGWYTEEKAEYDSGNIAGAGHYLNIINSSYKYTGFAYPFSR